MAKTNLVVLFAVMLSFLSCSEGPQAPQKGSPAFLWQAARETWAAGDFQKTLEHLDKLLADNNEYTARALPWSLVLTSGLSKGYAEWADAYEIGARANKSDPSTFRRQVSNSRGFASRLALQVADNFVKFQNSKDENVLLAFPYPAGSAAPVAALGKAASGVLLPAAEIEAAQKRTLERSILLTACRAAGAPDDTARTQELLKAPDAKVPRNTFLLAMANSLYEQAQIFSPAKMAQPDKFRILAERAGDIVKGLPESKETKSLKTRIEGTLKKSKQG